MTLYEKFHTASKEELAEFLALGYGMYASQNNERFNNNSIPGFVAYFGFGMYDAIKNHILEELNEELEDLEFVKNFKNELEIADCEKQQGAEKAKKTEADKKRREASKKKGTDGNANYAQEV